MDEDHSYYDSNAEERIQKPDHKDGTEYAMQNCDIKNILEQNEEYVQAMGQDFFDDLGSKHRPKYMWIGCADARAPANELMVCTVRAIDRGIRICFVRPVITVIFTHFHHRLFFLLLSC